MRPLLEKRAETKAKDKYYGFIALHWGAKNGHKAVVPLLLEGGADIQARTSPKSADLDKVDDFVSRLIDGLRLKLLDNNTINDFQGKEGWTALHWAVQNGDEAMVRLLLAVNIDVRVKDEAGWTAQDCAAAGGHHCVIALIPLQYLIPRP